MKAVLMDNAFEAWAAAIRYCNDIKDGKASLQYQKNFVSSLHNAVELIMKQMMLNNNDHRVAFIKEPKDEIDEKLSCEYYKAANLNHFFETLSSEEISRFQTIQFYKLIRLHKKLFGHSLDRGESLSAELRLLQRLRNNETHFMIRQGNFLTEENFRVLHNFMVRFYKIMKTWWPIDGDDLELSIYLYWDWFNPDKGSGPCGFDYAPLQEFSYKVAVKNSKLAKDIAEALKGGYQYGAPDFSPYAIAVDLANGYNGLSAQFDEIWAMVHMMQSLGLIVVKDILDDEHGQIHYAMSVLL